MNIFISYYAADDHLFHRDLVKALQKKKHKAYPKHLKGFFGASGLHDPDALDEHLRDEDLCIIMLSKSYKSDSWLQGEMHALFTLDRKLRPNFAIPVFLTGIEDEEIPIECFNLPHVDFRGKTFEAGMEELLKIIDKVANPRVSVFISHSHEDKEIVSALADLLKFSFKLSAGEIVSTSVGGGRLPWGANVSETLRRRIREAKSFICIATQNSLGSLNRPSSFYVALEVGARWGMKRSVAVMLAAGATGSLLEGPLKEQIVLSCDDISQIQQFIREIARILGRDPEPAEATSAAINNLLSESKKAAASATDGKPKSAGPKRRKQPERRGRVRV